MTGSLEAVVEGRETRNRFGATRAPGFEDVRWRVGVNNARVRLKFIKPSKPGQNALLVESFKVAAGRMFERKLVFMNAADALRRIEAWRWRYKLERPHICWIIQRRTSSRRYTRRVGNGFASPSRS